MIASNEAMQDYTSIPSIDRARKYVSRMPVAVSGQRGHDKTFHVACVLLHGFALSVEDAATVLYEYSSRCSPPWSGRELEHKLEDASNTQSKYPEGYLLRMPSIPYQENLLCPAVLPKPIRKPIAWLKPKTGSDASDTRLELLTQENTSPS
jgi:hypothetical protein